MKIYDIIKDLEIDYPRYLAYDFDNPGLNAGDINNDLNGIVLALDVDKDAINFSIEKGCNMIISHHPLIFEPIKNVDTSTMVGDLIISLIKNNISSYSMHTNFDVKHDIGMADIVKNSLFDKNEISSEEYMEDICENNGLGKIIKLKNIINIDDVRYRLIERMNIDKDRIRIYTKDDSKISTIAILPGSGKSDIDKVIGAKADLYLSGDLAHNHILELLHNDISYIDCTHYGLEKIFVDFMYDYIIKKYKDIKIYKYENKYL